MQFYILFNVLINTGPQDEMMSSAFQASLKVGYMSIILTTTTNDTDRLTLI